MNSTVLLVLIGVPALIVFFIVFSFFSTWLKAMLNGAPVGMLNLLGMRPKARSCASWAWTISV